MRIRSIHYSQVGRGHIETGQACQDFSKTYQDKSVSIMVIADGAGSQVHSAQGARIAVEQTIRYFRKQPFDGLDDEAICEKVIQAIQDRIITSKEFSGQLRQYASTLLFCVLDKKNGRYLIGHLGDGMVVSHQRGRLAVASYPENGEYANMTYFTTTKEASKHLRLQRGNWQKQMGFMLMTDGAANSLYQVKTKQLAPAITTLFDWLQNNAQARVKQALQQALAQQISQKTKDDCTIAMNYLY